MSTPKLHQSAAKVCPLRLTTSGAMYSTVPQNEYALSSSRFSFDRPKSVTAMWPFTSRRRLKKKEI